MLHHSVRRFAGLVTALLVALVISAQDAFAVVLPDPGAIDGTAPAEPASSGFEFLVQPWQGALAIVVVAILVVALAIIATRRQQRVAHA